MTNRDSGTHGKSAACSRRLHSVGVNFVVSEEFNQVHTLSRAIELPLLLWFRDVLRCTLLSPWCDSTQVPSSTFVIHMGALLDHIISFNTCGFEHLLKLVATYFPTFIDPIPISSWSGSFDSWATLQTLTLPICTPRTMFSSSPANVPHGGRR